MGILPGLFSDHELMNWKTSFLLMSRLSSTSSSSIPCFLETLIQEDDDVRGVISHCTKLHFRKLRIQKPSPVKSISSGDSVHIKSANAPEIQYTRIRERGVEKKQKDKTRKAAVVDI